MTDPLNMNKFPDNVELEKDFVISPSPVITGLGPENSQKNCHAKYGRCKPLAALTSQSIRAGVSSVYKVMGSNPLPGFLFRDFSQGNTKLFAIAELNQSR